MVMSATFPIQKTNGVSYLKNYKLSLSDIRYPRYELRITEIKLRMIYSQENMARLRVLTPHVARAPAGPYGRFFYLSAPPFTVVGCFLGTVSSGETIEEAAPGLDRSSQGSKRNAPWVLT